MANIIPSNDTIPAALEAALVTFYASAFRDETDRDNGSAFSANASRHIAEARGIDLANAAPAHLQENMMRLAFTRTMASRGFSESVR